MKNQIRSMVREAVERIPSERAYLAAMRQLSGLGGGRLKIERRDGLVVLNGRHHVPSARRLPFYLRGLDYRAKKLGGEYLLDHVQFEPEDVVVDCGANVGDLLLALNARGVPLRYIAYEPGAPEFRCLKENVAQFPKHKTQLHRKALSNENGTATFYVNSGAADNSMFKIDGATDAVLVDTVRLDAALSGVPKVKLLKLEAEGFEPEILDGAAGILDRIEYIAADVGFERGVAHESTLPAVTNFLLARGFKVIANGKDRLVLLFKNEAG